MRKRFRTHRIKKVIFIILGITIFSFFINKKILSSIVDLYFYEKENKIIFNKEKFLNTFSFNINEKTEKTFHEINYLEHDIYLYNTHQTEEYSDYNVVDGTKYLKTLLINNGINVGFDEINVIDEINLRNLSYRDTYKITRELILNNKHDECLYIDIHRDSVNKSATTLDYNGKNYAKVMFVIGGAHDNYEKNYDVASAINELIIKKIPGISRGLFVRKNSNYNQDLDPNIILIELGGTDNTKEEVINTLEVLSDVLTYYIGD